MLSSHVNKRVDHDLSKKKKAMAMNSTRNEVSRVVNN